MTTRGKLDLDAFLRTLEYEVDIRNDLDSRRRSEIWKGWTKGAQGRELGPSTLKRLTWHNLGFRAGRRFPNASDREMEAVLDGLELRYLCDRLRSAKLQ